GRARSDDEDLLAGRAWRCRQCPALLQRQVAEEALHRVDADGLVERRPVAGAFARVVAHAAHRRRHGVVLDQGKPRRAVVTAFRVEEPPLDVLSRGARVVARGKLVDIDGAIGPPRARLVGEARAGIEGDGEGLPHSPNSSMFASAIAWIAPMVAVSGVLPK